MLSSFSLWLWISIATSLFMTGLIWFVQIVHYPMFHDVGLDAFAEYERIHQQRTTWVVMPVMLVELAAAILILLLTDAGHHRGLLYASLGLLILIWLSTAFLQVPAHNHLLSAFDPEAYRSLVRTNWIRTVAWSARSGLLIAVAIRR